MSPSPLAVLSAAVLLCLAHLTLATPTTPPTPGTWIYAKQGLSCTDACATRSPSAPCHLASLQAVDTDAEFSRVASVAFNQSGVACFGTVANQEAHAPAMCGYNPCSLGSSFSTCEASNPDWRRLCCCGDTACSTDYTPVWQLEGINVVAPAVHNNLDMYVCSSVLVAVVANSPCILTGQVAL